MEKFQARNKEHKVILRMASIRDLDQIVEVEKLSFIDPYSRRFLAVLILSAPIFIVVEYGKKIVGYICATVEKDDVLYGHIISIAVHPSYRRKGIGSALLLRTIENLKKMGVKMVYLECRVSNRAAIKFYEKHGFRIIKRVPSYYRDGEDAYVMMRNIAG